MLELDRFVDGNYDCVTFRKDDYVIMEVVEGAEKVIEVKLYETEIQIITPVAHTNICFGPNSHGEMSASEPPYPFSKYFFSRAEFGVREKKPDDPKETPSHMCPTTGMSFVCSNLMFKIFQHLFLVQGTIDEALKEISKK